MSETIVTTKRTKAIVRASVVGIAGNLILAILKVIIGFVSASFAVLADGIDSATDILTSFITLLAAKITNRPPDKDHPYGHGRAEAIAAKLLSFIIFFAGFQLAVITIEKIISSEPKELPGNVTLYVTAFSILAKLLLAWYLRRVGKETNSLMLAANAKNMRNDVLISVSVLLGLVFTFVLKISMLDQIVAFLVSLWVIKAAVSIFMESSVELMDGNSNDELYAHIFKAVLAVPGASNPHRTRLRRIGEKYIIDMDIEVSGDLSVFEAHKIAMNVEQQIRRTIDNVYDVIVHIEPEGNIEHDECYGLSERLIESEKNDLN